MSATGPELLGGLEVRAVMTRVGRVQSLRGFDPVVGRLVLLRALDAGPDDADARAFEASTRRAAAVVHPAASVLLSAGTSPAGVRWAAFAHPGGTSLVRRVMTAGPLPLQDALGLGLALASALAAHEAAGVRHGGVRPEAVALDDEGRPVLFDLLLGKPLSERAHAAPEEGRPEADARADLFGLGATLAWAASGRAADAEPAARLPAPLDHLVAGLCARALVDRYRSAHAALCDLARALRGAPVRGVSAPDAPPTRAERAELLVSEAGTLAIGPALLAAFPARPAPATPPRPADRPSPSTPPRPADRPSARHRGTFYDPPTGASPAPGAGESAGAPPAGTAAPAATRRHALPAPPAASEPPPPSTTTATDATATTATATTRRHAAPTPPTPPPGGAQPGPTPAAAPAAQPPPAAQPAQPQGDGRPGSAKREKFSWDQAAPDWSAILEKREYFFRYMASGTRDRFTQLARPEDEPLESVIAAAGGQTTSSAGIVFLSDDGARAYRLLRELGRGGQGVVYEVEVAGDQRFAGFDHPVTRAALKVSRNEEALERERKAYDSNERPGVIKLLDRGSIQGRERPRPYLVLERLYPHPFQLFSSGADRTPVDLATAVDTYVNLLEVLHGLHFRRDGSLVLCDVKPDNIMIRTSNREGTPSLGEYLRRIASGAYEPVFMDMGCAQDRDHLRRTNGQLDELIGTPLYLPPEAIPFVDGAFVPGRYSDKTDVYALTLSFYEYLTGDRPYSARGLWSSGHGGQLLADLLALKASKDSPIDPAKVEARAGADAAPFLDLIHSGLHPDPEARGTALGLLERAKQAFKVKQRYVRQLGEYRWDQAKGVRLMQERFAPIHPVENAYVEARRRHEAEGPGGEDDANSAALDTVDL